MNICTIDNIEHKFGQHYDKVEGHGMQYPSFQLLKV